MKIFVIWLCFPIYLPPFIIYADLECITEKTDACKINPEN